jgi:hypothetical protein
VRLALEFFQRGTQPVESTHQEVLLVVEVGVKSRAAHVRAINDVLHGECLKAILLDQTHQGRAEELLRPLNTSVIFFGSHPILIFRTFAGRSFDSRQFTGICAEVTEPNVLN